MCRYHDGDMAECGDWRRHWAVDHFSGGPLLLSFAVHGSRSSGKMLMSCPIAERQMVGGGSKHPQPAACRDPGIGIPLSGGSYSAVRHAHLRLSRYNSLLRRNWQMQRKYLAAAGMSLRAIKPRTQLWVQSIGWSCYTSQHWSFT